MRDADGCHGHADAGQDDLDLLFLTTYTDDGHSIGNATPQRKRSGTGCLALILVVVLTLALATCTALLATL